MNDDGKHIILLVDDDEDMLMLMKHKLKAEGFDTQVSQNAAGMLDMIAQTPPDMVLLDIHMDGVDGGTVCRLLKSNKSTAGIPVVLFSANENISLITEQCGAEAFVKKPFDSARFKEIFQQFLQRRA